MVVEQMHGSLLRNSIVGFPPFRKSEFLEIFSGLGSTLRESHHISLENLHKNFSPGSLQEIKLEISSLAGKA